MRGFGKEGLSMEKGHSGTEMGMYSTKENGRLVSLMGREKCTIWVVNLSTRENSEMGNQRKASIGWTIGDYD